jgi:hypothetical protein
MAVEIAAEVRRRPVGAVIADICHDLGIAPGQLDGAFWDEIRRAIILYGGNLLGFVRNTNTRWFAYRAGDATWHVVPPRRQAPATGPP